MKINCLFLILLLSSISSISCMQKPEKQTASSGINEKGVKTFELFNDLDPELQIYVLSIPLLDIVKNNNKPEKVLKKALSFIHSIKTVNGTFYNFRKALYIKLKEIIAHKFVPAELLGLDQEQKDSLLKNCLASIKAIECRSIDDSELPNKEINIRKLREQTILCVLAGADPEIITNIFINRYKYGIGMYITPKVEFLNQILFLAMIYGVKIDKKLEDNSYKDLDVKAFLISLAVEHITKKSLNVVKFILKSNLDPNAKVYGRGGNWKLLHIAAYDLRSGSCNKLELIKLLLQFGAKKDLRTDPVRERHRNAKIGYSAYDLAESAGANQEILDCLQIDEKLMDPKSRCLAS